MFNKIFGSSSKSNTSKLPWIALENNEQLEGLVKASQSKLQLIFKHSTRCGISRMVMRQFEKDYPFSEAAADLHYLDVLKHREVSNLVANTFEVRHESPQLIIIERGAVKVSASHGGVNNLNISDLV